MVSNSGGALAPASPLSNADLEKQFTARAVAAQGSLDSLSDHLAREQADLEASVRKQLEETQKHFSR